MLVSGRALAEPPGPSDVQSLNSPPSPASKWNASMRHSMHDGSQDFLRSLRWRRRPWPLSGCGSGGTVSVGKPDGDDGERSLMDKRQQFEDGARTLRVRGEKMSDAWSPVPRKSTDRVVLAGPASVDSDPGPAIPLED